ncbi:MAG TPA: metallophosphoesterase family protein [Candidatus Binataceae bacterium]|nr:metallophosphoesterase family protein [Candidatus Binataceae bacterium]
MAQFPYLLGLISDTHGLMRPEALDALRGVNLIIHAGDIGNPAVLEALAQIAPVRAVRGNNDKGQWTESLPAVEVVEIGRHSIYVLHNVAELDLEPTTAGFAAVVSGHSHVPSVNERQRVLYVNPGSAGPRRFKLPVTVAKMTLHSEHCEATIVPLQLPQHRTAKSEKRLRH